MIDPEEAARRAAAAADAEDMAGGQEPSEADRALAEGGAATDGVDVSEAVAAADVSPPAAEGVPGIPPRLGDAGSAEESDEPGGSARQDESPAPASPTVEHPLPVAASGEHPAPEPSGPSPVPAASSSAADGPPPSAGTTPPEAAGTLSSGGPPSSDIHVHAPGFAVADTPVHGTPPLPDAEDFIERAIESVLEQVPEVADDAPEGSAKLQPWAETAAPPSKNKRPLSELLEQYAARVAADPEAVAGRPRGQHPVAAFFARFTPQGGGRSAEGAGGGRGRRRRGRRGAPQEAAPAPQKQQPAAQQRGGGRPPRGPRPQGEQRPPRQPGAAPQEGGQRRSRHRRRRGRGGGGGGGGGGAPAQG